MEMWAFAAETADALMSFEITHSYFFPLLININSHWEKLRSLACAVKNYPLF
jgi:hypothetical protein